MASNLFVKIGGALKKVGEFVADAVKDVVGLTTKVETVLKTAKTLEPEFVGGLSQLVGDVELLVSNAEGAVTSEGLNFAADSAVYQQFLKLIADARALGPVVQQALALLEGKSQAPASTAPAEEPATVIDLDAAAPVAVSAVPGSATKLQLAPGVIQHG